MADQSFASLSWALATSVPFASRCAVTESGRRASLSPSSDHTFFTPMPVVCAACVFVMAKPASALPVTFEVYPSGTFSSATEYSIFLPSAFLSRPVHAYVHWLSALSVTASPTAWPSAYSCTCTESGRRPSRLSASSQFFATETDVFSGPPSSVLVMIKPSVALPVTED